MSCPGSLLALLLLLPAAAAAQTHPLAGRWTLEMETGRMIENGFETPIISKGTFDVTVAGDSVIAVLALEPTEGRPARPPIRMAALRTATPTVFVHHGEATVTMNGAEAKHPMTMTITATTEGDALQGTVAREIEGVEMLSSQPQPFTGKRAPPA
jgi:hypothetical protein